MLVIFINLALVYTFSYVARLSAKLSHSVTYSELGKPNKLLIFFVMMALALVSGLRKNIGDTTGYMLSYTLLSPSSWDQTHKEKGFLLLQLLLHRISDDPQILIFTVAFITNILIVAVLCKYSKLFELSVYVYITSGLYIVSMNGIRQFLAGAILFAATKYLFDGKWIKYILLILLASTIHQSALIFIAIYFFVRRKAWTKTTFFLIATAVIVVIGYNQFSGTLLQLAGDYSHYADSHEKGANIIRVLVSAAPLLIAYLGREKLRSIFPKSDYIVNMCLMGLVFMIISTQNWIFARYEIYFGLYNLILVSWLVELFTKRERKFIYFVILVFYLIFFYYENVITLNIHYKSDYLNFLL